MKSTVFSAVAVSIGFAILGWDFAALLEANLHMKKEFELVNGPSINNITIAVSAFGAIMITIFSGSLLDWLGRRAVLVHSSMLLFFGGVLVLWSPNIYILLLTRLIMGSGSGFGFHLCPNLHIRNISSKYEGIVGNYATVHVLCRNYLLLLSYVLVYTNVFAQLENNDWCHRCSFRRLLCIVSVLLARIT